MADMKRFTERSPLVLVEAKEVLSGSLGEMIGANAIGHTEFYTYGSFDSSVLCRRVYAGLKTRPKDKNLKRDNAYLMNSLSNLILLDDVCPELSELMPAFFGAVIKEDKLQGMLMEDYSYGGQNEIYEAGWFESDIVLDDFSKYLDVDLNSPMDKMDISKMFTRTDEGLRFMDVNCIPWKKEYEPRRMEIIGELLSEEGLKPYVVEV